MKLQIILSILVMAPVAEFGQPKSDRIKLLTVCEVIGNRPDYAGASVVIIGRKESSVSLFDSYEFVSQDHCRHPIVTHGHAWSNKILIWTTPDEGMPTPPEAMPNLARSAIAPKLSLARKDT